MEADLIPQTKIAGDLGVAQTLVSRWLSGNDHVNYERMDKLMGDWLRTHDEKHPKRKMPAGLAREGGAGRSRGGGRGMGRGGGRAKAAAARKNTQNKLAKVPSGAATVVGDHAIRATHGLKGFGHASAARNARIQADKSRFLHSKTTACHLHSKATKAKTSGGITPETTTAGIKLEPKKPSTLCDDCGMAYVGRPTIRYESCNYVPHFRFFR